MQIFPLAMGKENLLNTGLILRSFIDQVLQDSKQNSRNAAVANATSRSILFANRDKNFFLYPNSYWEIGFLGGSHEFLRNGARYLDASTRMFYYATGITPAMAVRGPV